MIRGKLIALCAAAFLALGPVEATAQGHEPILRQLPAEIDDEQMPVQRLFYGLLDEVQIAQLGRAGVNTVGDFVEVDPAHVGRILGLEPGGARALQHDIGQRFPVPPSKGR